jgi:hypothetical protein
MRARAGVGGIPIKTIREVTSAKTATIKRT